MTFFSGIPIYFARAIIASYYYHCKYEVIQIIVITELLKGRIEYLYTDFKPKTKLAENEYKKEVEKFKKFQHRFDSKYGDFLTVLNIYTEYKKFIRAYPNCDNSLQTDIFSAYLNIDDKESKMAETYYKFDTVKFVSSGARDPDSDGITGASASAARKSVLDDDYAQFEKITGSGKYSKQLWLKLKNAMSLKEMGGVGVVATNKKMAKDPRYSTSMTQDVGTNTFMNNLKALKLAEKEK